MATGDKSQGVRLLDVWVLGPFMVWYAVESEDMDDWARLALGASGVATVLYNARNYQRRRQAERAAMDDPNIIDVFAREGR